MKTREGLWATVAAALAVALAFSSRSAAADEIPQAPPAPRDAPASVRWDLATVVATALANHPSVRQADAETRAAAARQGLAEAAYYPQVSGLAGWNWAESPSVTSGDQTRTRTGRFQASATQLITDFGRSGALTSRAANLVTAAQESGRSTRIEVAFAAKTAYFNILRSMGVVEVGRETVRQRESLLKQARAFFDAGLKARIDVVRAEANLLQARAELTSREHGVNTARLHLLSVMGIDGPKDFELAVAPLAPPAPPAAGAIEEWQWEAEENHPELRGLRMQVAASQNALRAARLSDNPSFTGVGQLGWSGDETPLDRSWTIGLQVSVPFFNGFLARHQTTEAGARLAVANFTLENRRRQIRFAVEDAAQSITEAEQQIRSREKEREAFAENLRLATGRYEAGAGDIIEIVDAQLQMTGAETNLIEAQFDYQIAFASLNRAIGRLP